MRVTRSRSKDCRSYRRNGEDFPVNEPRNRNSERIKRKETGPAELPSPGPKWREIKMNRNTHDTAARA